MKKSNNCVSCCFCNPDSPCVSCGGTKSYIVCEFNYYCFVCKKISGIKISAPNITMTKDNKKEIENFELLINKK